MARGSGSASAATRAWCMVRSALADDDDDVEDAATTSDGVEALPGKAKEVLRGARFHFGAVREPDVILTVTGLIMSTRGKY